MQGTRFEHRKKKRINSVLNVAIGVVVILILFFAAQIFLGMSESEEVSVESETEETEIEQEEPNQAVNEDENDEASNVEEDLNNVEEEDPQEEEQLEPVPDGEWQPIGTEQTGEFSHDFTKNSVNWNEMTKAIQYATGLGDDMIVWRLENGGSATSALGTVSAPDKQDTPYQVRLEWIDGQGWLPVEKVELESNPYKG
ncbi:YrrS family protein [Halalkalibacter urbisdiaboli]|uniref:YrrS family protein n=1 Tax=Halalkalibacter urbisdiaboli TaxID=1960589 RepID=UPI000B453860|nr:YrrS family protein [Halalkalibacter urbisdiaboli]